LSDDTQRQLVRLLRRAHVMDMPALRNAFPDRSQRSIIRDLVAVGYLASCNLDGRFYTLAATPEFDTDGLWRHDRAIFSRHGTLKASVRHLVEKAEDGRTHPELQARLQLRIHDTLLDLVQQGQIAREMLNKLFLYVSADLQVGAAQVARRRAEMAPEPAPLDAEGVIAVLLTLIQHGARQPEQVVAQLRSEGRAVSLAQVAQVFARYDLGKKNSPLPP